MRRQIPFFVITMVAGCFLSGCQRDMPKSETKPKITSIVQMSTKQSDALPVFYQKSKEIPSLFVQYQTRGNNVLVECIVTGISFRESDRTKEKIGKMVVWIDGKRNQVVDSAAFIIKGLSPGGHKVKLEVVALNNEPYGLEKEILVNIPK